MAHAEPGTAATTLDATPATTSVATPSPTDGAPPSRVRRLLRSPSVWACALVAVLTVAVRIPAVNFGLPYIWHPDEPINVLVGAHMVDHRTWDTHFWAYPSLLIYVIAIVAHVQALFGGWVKSAGVQWQNIGVAYTSDPHLFLALRLVSVIASAGTAIFVFWAATAATRRWWAGLFSGLLIAIAPVLVQNGVYITPDVYSAMFSAAAILCAVLVYRRGRTIDYVLAGVAVGLAAGSKYNAAVAIVPVVVAHVLRLLPPRDSDPGSTSDSPASSVTTTRRVWPLLVAGGVAIVVFVISTPGVITNTQAFYDQATAQARLYANGKSGLGGSSLHFYVSQYFAQGAIYAIAGVLAVLGAVGRRWRLWLIPATFTVAYLALISVQNLHADRDLIIAFDGVAVAAAIGLVNAVEYVRPLLRRPRVRLLAGVIVSVLLAALMISPIRTSLALRNDIGGANQRAAQRWIYSHVPAGTKIVVDSYGPWLDPHRYSLRELPFVVDASTSSLPERAVVIVTGAGSGRFLSDPSAFPAQAAAYRLLQAQRCVGATYGQESWITIFVPCPHRTS